ncbi:MAG: T9SS type A sorting domain-containing protein [Flavobacteriales bacterium]|nr:T9SS type A sorting domain-containing protein [Flavobacteriales bacterium]
MKKNFKKEFKSILALLLSLFSSGLMAQEMLFDLNSNPVLHQYDNYLRNQSSPSRAAGDTLQLPFFDDFSEPFSRLQTAADLYPNSDKWLDNKAYINNHMAINPISQGVATFDGLDERGRAYGFGFSLATISDSLTSKPINLFGAIDTVYLSFYYQAQGLGNAPESSDILLMEFKDTAGIWERIWEVAGYNLEDYKFNRVMLPVLGEEYLHAGFQFRFINYASRAGNVDHWHVDYIELDEGRFAADTLINDVAFMGQTSIDHNGITLNKTSSVLKEYNSMPWDHFKVDPAAYMGDSSYFAIRNNTYASSPSGKYTMQIYDSNGTLIHTGVEAAPDVLPNIICGNEVNDCALTVGGVQDLLYDTVDFVLPTAVELSEDSMFFEVVHNINELSDAVSTNDRTSDKQEFYNYYAYDDGTAEAAYGLGELENVGMVAMKYDIKKEDFLRGIQLYLNPVEFDLTDEPVNLAVWTGNEQPEEMIWQSPDTNLYYTNQINYFYHYLLDTVLPVVDNIWVGWIQQPATNMKFSVGFDKRTDASSKVFYNLGTTWNQSSIPGSVMIRPVVGEPYSWVGVGEKPTVQHINVYPNPSTGDVYLEEAFSGQFRTAQITVYDISGRSVHTQTGYTGQLQLRHLHSGTYILRVDTKEGVFTERLVLQP